MAIRTHAKVGQPIELFPRKFHKTILRQSFVDPETGKAEDYFYFDDDRRPAIVLPLTASGEVIAGRQFRYPSDRIFLELPGGSADGDEDMEEAMRRELREETGFEAGKMTRLAGGQIWFDPSSFSVAYTPFLATGCAAVGSAAPDGYEHLEVALNPFRTWLEMIQTGKVEDAKSIATTFLAFPHLGITLNDLRSGSTS